MTKLSRKVLTLLLFACLVGLKLGVVSLLIEIVGPIEWDAKLFKPSIKPEYRFNKRNNKKMERAGTRNHNRVIEIGACIL